MKAVVLILFVVLILVVAWFAMGNSGPPSRVRRRVVERPAPRRVVRRRATYVEETPGIVEEEPGVVEERRTLE